MNKEENNEEEGIINKLDESAEKVVDFAKRRKIDTAAYIILVIGIIFSFFDPTIGGAIVGLIAGLYYCDEINMLCRGISDYVEEEGSFKPMVLAGTLVCLFFALPAFFVALGIICAIRGLLSKS